MGIWAFYTTCHQSELVLIRDSTHQEPVSRTLPYFEYSEMYKFWYGLHLMLTDGLEEPCEDNILSNAVAGQFFLWGGNSEWGDGCWWWDCHCPASNDSRRVKEIAKALIFIDVNTVINPSRFGITDNFKPLFLEKFIELRHFYTQASIHELAVIASFG